MSLKRYKVEKLFYNTYRYKLAVRNSLVHLFREKKFQFAKQELDKMQTFYNAGKPIHRQRGLRSDTIKPQDFLEAKTLLKKLENGIDFKIRIENVTMQVYSNDLKWLESLAKSVSTLKEIYEIDDNYAHLHEKNIIVKDKPFKYKYKVYLKYFVDPSFEGWANNNRDKIRIGDILLQYIKHKNYVKGMYFYVRDDKILQLVNLMIGNSIQRVDKIVSTADLDK